MESVATFTVVLIMKLMPQIKLCVIYKHGAITYVYTHDRSDIVHRKWTV